MYSCNICRQWNASVFCHLFIIYKNKTSTIGIVYQLLSKGNDNRKEILFLLQQTSQTSSNSSLLLQQTSQTSSDCSLLLQQTSLASSDCYLLLQQTSLTSSDCSLLLQQTSLMSSDCSLMLQQTSLTSSKNPQSFINGSHFSPISGLMSSVRCAEAGSEPDGARLNERPCIHFKPNFRDEIWDSRIL